MDHALKNREWHYNADGIPVPALTDGDYEQIKNRSIAELRKLIAIGKQIHFGKIGSMAEADKALMRCWKKWG